MRLLFALLALLSGLSVPQAVSAAVAGRVDSSVVASETVAAAPMRRDCVIACSAPPRAGRESARTKTVWLPTLAYTAPAAPHFGVRARE